MQLELKRIQREVGITFIFVTHDQEEALTMSDRIAVMSDGHVEQVGTPEEIYDSPATAVRRRLHRLREPARRRASRACAATSRRVRLAGDRVVEAADRRRPPLRARRRRRWSWSAPSACDCRVEQPAAGVPALPVTVHRADLPGARACAACCATRPATRSSPTSASDRRLAKPGTGEPGWASWDADAARLLPPRAAA